MKKKECEICEAETGFTNPKFTLQELTILGYEEKDFCSKKCFIKYIIKRFGGKIKGLLKK